MRAQRTVGKKVVQPLAELDLDAEIPLLSDRVRSIAARAPGHVDTLVFGLFDGVDDDGAGLYTGFHLTGASDATPEEEQSQIPSPRWIPVDRFLESASLDALARAAFVARGEVKSAVGRALRFGAAALLSRFASASLPYRVVVSFDDGDTVEISAGRSVTRADPKVAFNSD